MKMKNAMKIIFILASLLILPASVLAASLFVTPQAQAADDQNLVCSYGTVSGSYGDFVFNWYKNGNSRPAYTSNGVASSTSGYAQSTLAASLTTSGDSWICEVMAFGDVLDRSSSPVQIVNSGASQQTVIAGDLVVEDYFISEVENAVCSVKITQLAKDLNDYDKIDFVWFKNGQTVKIYGPVDGVASADGEYSVSALSPAYFDGGDQVYCEAWSFGDLIARSDYITVEVGSGDNPAAGTVRILPYNPTVDDNLVCTIQPSGVLQASDYDNFKFYWFEGDNTKATYGPYDGVNINGTPGNTLLAQVERGETWRCEVLIYGDNAGSASTIIVNSLPTITAPRISPVPARTTDDLTCTAGTTSDSDWDTVGIEYAWLVNGNVLAGETANTLADTNFVKYDNVTCRTIPYDMYGGVRNYGQSADATITIENTCPQINLPRVESLTFNEKRTLDYSAYVYDADNEAIGLAFSGNSRIGVSVSGLDVTYTAPATRAAELITFTASDGVCSNSDAVQVVVDGNMPPVVNFTYSPSQPRIYETVTFTDRSTDPEGDAMTYEWDFDNNGVVDSTARNPTYQYTVPGNYTVRLTVTDSRGASATATGQITVTARLNVDLIVCVSNRIMQGEIQSCAVRVSAEGRPVTGATVTSYFTDGSVFGTCTTNPVTGTCLVQRTMNQLGTYTIYAHAEMTNYISDLNDQPQATFTVIPQIPNGSIEDLNTYNDANYSVQDSDFFRGENLYVKFRVIDTVTGGNLTNVVTQVTLQSPAGGLANLSVEKNLGDGWYYYSLEPIAANHNFKGQSQVFTFVFRMSDNTMLQREVFINIMNNVPVIVEPLPVVSVNASSTATVDLSSYKTDVEDSGANLTWSVIGSNDNIFTVSVVGDTLTVNGISEGQGTITLILSDLDGDVDIATMNVLVGTVGLSVTSVNCIDTVITGGTQSCSVGVSAGGVIVGGVDVNLYYNDSSYIDSCTTDNLTGACNVVFTAGLPGNYSVYATAEKTGYEPDLDNVPSDSFEVLPHIYDVMNITTYNDTAFSMVDNDFFRGENVYIKFQVFDINNGNAIVTDAISEAYLISPPGGIANMSEIMRLNDGWYYLGLEPIPLTHYFLGNSQILAFAFNTSMGGGGVENVTITIRNNPPTISAIADMSLVAGNQSDISLGAYANDLEDNDSVLRYTVEVENASVISAAVVGDSLRITPIAAGNSRVRVVVTDLDGDSAETSFNVQVTGGSVIEDDSGNEMHLKVEKIRLPFDESAKAGETALFTLHVNNDGDMDIDNVKITATIDGVPYARKSVGPFGLDEGDEVTKELVIDIPIEIPEGTAEGIYAVKFVITGSDGKDMVKRVKYRFLRITE
jgi:PKD repeat protein